MSSSAVDVSAIAPLQHGEAMRLLDTELQFTVDLLAQLGPAEWTAQTACPDWDVRRMYLHVKGNGGESIVIDAPEFCRVMSGRAPGTGLLATVVPF